MEREEGFGEQSAHLQRQREDKPRARLKEHNVTQHSHDLQNSHGLDVLCLKTNKQTRACLCGFSAITHHHPPLQSFVQYY